MTLNPVNDSALLATFASASAVAARNPTQPPTPIAREAIYNRQHLLRGGQ